MSLQNLRSLTVGFQPFLPDNAIVLRSKTTSNRIRGVPNIDFGFPTEPECSDIFPSRNSGFRKTIRKSRIFGPESRIFFMDKRQDSSSIRTLVLYLFLIPIYESLRRFTGTSPLEYNKSEFDLHVNLFSKWASVVLRRRLCNQRALRNRNRNAATRLPGSYCTVAVVSSPFEILFWFCIFWTSPSKVNSSFSFRDSGKCPEFRPNPNPKSRIRDFSGPKKNSGHLCNQSMTFATESFLSICVLSTLLSTRNETAIEV